IVPVALHAAMVARDTDVHGERGLVDGDEGQVQLRVVRPRRVGPAPRELDDASGRRPEEIVEDAQQREGQRHHYAEHHQSGEEAPPGVGEPRGSGGLLYRRWSSHWGVRLTVQELRTM